MEFEVADFSDHQAYRKSEQHYTLVTKLGKQKIPLLQEPAFASSIMRRRAGGFVFSAAGSEKNLDHRRFGVGGSESATTAKAFSSFKGDLSTPLQSI